MSFTLYNLGPFILVALGSVVIMLGVAIKRNHAFTLLVTLFALAGAFYFLGQLYPETMILIQIDSMSIFVMQLLCGAGMAITVFSYSYLKQQNEKHEEYYILLLLAILGSMILATSNHFVALFLGLELLSTSLYSLISYTRQENNLEAGIKYLVLAAVSSAFLLFGMALIYTLSGSMRFDQLAIVLFEFQEPTFLPAAGLAMMILGFGFKLALVPFHLWTPDVYQGAPAPVTALIASISKGGVFVLLLRFFFSFKSANIPALITVFTMIAIASMFTGNILALLQNNVKRILAYSSIAHMGYLLVAFLADDSMAMAAGLFYLAAYFVTIIGAFGMITLFTANSKEPEKIEQFNGLFWQKPGLSLCFMAMLLSLAGMPLTIGFWGKFYIISAGISSSQWLLVFSLVINSALSIFYYVRIILALLVKPDADTNEQSPLGQLLISTSGLVIMVIITGMLVWIGLYPTALVQIIQTAAGG